ncbi:type II toxin-antitoxin system HicB family antitoxin [Advenella sp. WQ 585]|uniref:Type II toxin-antitoxin system HicB family antitoxin n=1 Tax=Advenella mandrilli TaxID=2800330 RepID=A0ABS1EGE5_9BURK|nr:type II toxin-antitoxin system HicB family antitoxin [Advenella mandrilli]MBK1782078.1 type II toxin-antitoxin system HicB family antitoxin [Advenella mandrilli]
MLIYPVTLIPDDNDTFLVEFPDIPEANSIGDDEQEALLNAEDALEAALEIYFDEKRPIPMPSKVKKGQSTVILPALVTAKVLLMNEMLDQKVRKAELARRLDVHMPQVDRLLDLRHSTKLEFIESAYHKLGKQISISIV